MMGEQLSNHPINEIILKGRRLRNLYIKGTYSPVTCIVSRFTNPLSACVFWQQHFLFENFSNNRWLISNWKSFVELIFYLILVCIWLNCCLTRDYLDRVWLVSSIFIASFSLLANEEIVCRAHTWHGTLKVINQMRA